MNIKSWWQHPFSVDMPVTGWIAFLLMVMLINVGWATILMHLRGGLET